MTVLKAHLCHIFVLNFLDNIMLLKFVFILVTIIFYFVKNLNSLITHNLLQISFTSIGLLTIILPLVKTFGIVIAIALIMGIFDGCFVSLMGPIAFEICGQKGASQAIGFILGLCSIPLTAGPPIAGIEENDILNIVLQQQNHN